MGIYNVSKIENWFDDFASASKKYNEYYNDFKSSYICSCGDSTISKMKKNLIEHYSRISKINNRINDIWKKYIHDLKAIDNALAGHKANFNDSTLSTKISKLPSLTTYKANLNTKINSASASIGTVTDIGWSETGSFLKNIKSFGEAIGATGAVVATSIESGIFKFLEDSADKLVFIIALSASEISEATGDKEWAQHIRDEATEMIAADNAKDYNDIFYKQTGIGRKINEKSMLKYDSKFGNKTQNAAKNVIKPVVSVLTGGAGSLIFGFLGGSSVEDKLKETGADLNKIAGETIIQSTIDAIDSYGKGKMGRGALDAAKAVTSTGSVKTALSDLVKTVFKKSNGKILTKETLKKTFKDVLKDPDTYLDSVYAALDNVKYDNENGLQVNWKGFAKETACNFAMNSVFSFIGSAFETKMTNGMKDTKIDNNLINKKNYYMKDLNVSARQKFLESLDISIRKNGMSEFDNCAKKLGVNRKELLTAFDKKINKIVDDSDFGIRITNENLYNVFKNGEFKNQFETGTTKGVADLSTREAWEKSLFGVPDDASLSDRPVYGMLFPKLEKSNQKSLNYFKDRYNGRSYGDTVVILKKDSVINDTTITFGDSLTYKVQPTEAANPKFNGGFNGIYSNINSMHDLANATISDLSYGINAYPEIQLHGSNSHSIKNIEKIIFMSPPDKKISKMLKKFNIPFEII